MSKVLDINLISSARVHNYVDYLDVERNSVLDTINSHKLTIDLNSSLVTKFANMTNEQYQSFRADKEKAYMDSKNIEKIRTINAQANTDALEVDRQIADIEKSFNEQLPLSRMQTIAALASDARDLELKVIFNNARLQEIDDLIDLQKNPW
jgi:hypothetical protein